MSVPETKIIEAVQKRYPKNKQVQISRSMPSFFGGELFVVEVTEDNKLSAESYVYVNSSHEVDTTFLNIDELAGWIDSDESPLRRGRKDWFSSNVISGIIAIIITLTICLILGIQQMRNNVLNVPDLLVNALTLILGFYFGQQASKARP